MAKVVGRWECLDSSVGDHKGQPDPEAGKLKKVEAIECDDGCLAELPFFDCRRFAAWVDTRKHDVTACRYRRTTKATAAAAAGRDHEKAYGQGKGSSPSHRPVHRRLLRFAAASGQNCCRP